MVGPSRVPPGSGRGFVIGNLSAFAVFVAVGALMWGRQYHKSLKSGLPTTARRTFVVTVLWCAVSAGLALDIAAFGVKTSPWPQTRAEMIQEWVAGQLYWFVYGGVAGAAAGLVLGAVLATLVFVWGKRRQ